MFLLPGGCFPGEGPGLAADVVVHRAPAPVVEPAGGVGREVVRSVSVPRTPTTRRRGGGTGGYLVKQSMTTNHNL